ncbi:hypothetical protein ABZU75_37615 [Streptosporangium sp. NPDC005286]|uniref:hypothetical protein n=1 Tax=Streptosporangium sp. NPDC005286 TaxID=3154463 RepID=UPI0033B30E1C
MSIKADTLAGLSDAEAARLLDEHGAPEPKSTSPRDFGLWIHGRASDGLETSKEGSS